MSCPPQCALTKINLKMQKKTTDQFPRHSTSAFDTNLTDKTAETMVFLRLRLPIALYLSIGAASLIGFVVIVQDYHLGASKVLSWIDMRTKAGHNHTTAPFFFAETSGKLYLEAREACSIESAALHHPQSNITFFTIGTFAPHDPFVSVLHNIPNIYIEHLNLSELFEGTPLAKWHQHGLIQESYFPIEHLSDAVRLAILWKFGGIYLDTDVIVVRAFDGVRNAVALQEPDVANGAILVFDRKLDFLSKCMADYVQQYSAGEWSQQGPSLITRNLKDVCKTDNLQSVVHNAYLCQGVTLLSEESFYPIPWPDWSKLFEQANTVDVDLSASYTVHLWGKLSRSKHSVPGSGTLLDQLALNNCPSTYQSMIKEQSI